MAHSSVGSGSRPAARRATRGDLEPEEIHEERHPPDLRRDHGDLYLWRHVHHAQHRGERRHPRRRLLAVPPLLHRQAEDSRHRWPRGPLREAVRRRSSDLTARRSASLTGSPTGAASALSAQSLEGRSARCSRRSRRSRPSTPSWSGRWRTRRCTPTRPTPAGSASGTPRSAPVVRTYGEWLQTGGDIEAARELAAEDPAFADEATELERRREELAEKLQLLLVPRDPSDDKDAILEIKAGEGGDESALFAGDLLRMYLKYAERSTGRPRSSTRPSPTSAGTSRHGRGEGARARRSRARRRTRS